MKGKKHFRFTCFLGCSNEGLFLINHRFQSFEKLKIVCGTELNKLTQVSKWVMSSDTHIEFFHKFEQKIKILGLSKDISCFESSLRTWLLPILSGPSISLDVFASSYCTVLLEGKTMNNM